MSGPSDIVLEVDRGTGAMTLKNNGAAAQAVGITAYEIESSVGSLDAAGFIGVSDDAGFTGWQKGGGSNVNRLFDAQFNSDTTLATGASLALGNGYNEMFATEDLTLRFTNAAGHVYDGVVQYVGIAPDVLPGDYNNNDVVDAADYTVWRDALGTAANLPNDPTPGTVDVNDYNLWKTNFGNVGSGAGLGASSAVPEPSALALLGLASALYAAVGFRRR